ncbi:sensor histidine kinase, partial [Candidatus Sumerlaeota bacterium]
MRQPGPEGARSRQVLELEDLDLSEIVGEMTKMMRRVIGEHITLNIRSKPDLNMVHADKGQLGQILINLCVNARDAMPEGGAITIETGGAELDDDFCSAHSWAKPGRYALLTVSDTGCGMNAETTKRIFEPFFTTKETGKGTGLGLATIYGIVRQHDGMVNVYSEVDMGTVFRIYLPVVEAPVATPQDVKKERPRGGNETILVAE